MKITSIKQQEKRKDRFSIFVDGKYAFSLSEAALLEQKLSNVKEIDKNQLKKFQKISANDKVYGNALRYVAMRSRSQWEMTDYLRRKHIEEPVAKRLITKLSNIGLLDDEKFAQAWVENRRLSKTTSRRRLIQELKQKRVPEEVIQKVLEDDGTDEQEILRDLVAKKSRQSKYKNDRLKLMQYLARQGFNYDDIKSVLSES